MKSLQKFLKESLNVNQYESLGPSMGLTPKRLTQVLVSPERMTADEITRLRGYIMSVCESSNIDFSELINDFKCGWNTITISEAENLVCSCNKYYMLKIIPCIK